MTLQRSIKFVSVLFIIFLTLLIFAIVEGENFVLDDFLVIALFSIPIIIWIIFDLKFNLIKLLPIYKTVLPSLLMIYLLLASYFNSYTDFLGVALLIPVIVIAHNSKFYPLKYAILPLSFMIALYIYVTIASIFSIWHPTWIILLVTPTIALFIDYTK